MQADRWSRAYRDRGTMQVEHVGIDKDHCIYCGESKHLMYAKSLQNFVDGRIETYIDKGILRTVYVEDDIAGMYGTLTHMLSEFHMRYCPVCGRDMSQEKHPELKDRWLKVTKDTVFELNEEPKCE